VASAPFDRQQVQIRPAPTSE